MKDVKFLIVVTGWNWDRYVWPCLRSIEAQAYNNYVISVVDDGSTDGSQNEIADYYIGHDRDMNVQYNKANSGTYYARDKAVKQCKFDYDVIVLLDGDDQLMPNALEVVTKQYEQGKLMTYGSWENQLHERCEMDIEYSDRVHADRSYRQDTFRCTHLRTFHRNLYESIPKWDITKSERESYPDAEILFSMMEMAGRDRIGVVKECIYMYNETNPNRTLKRFGKDDAGYAEICARPKREILNIEI